uniref:Uncharacterized protein n=1 Tax=Helianthus annuus TaxID=4232 RepID=A0A251UQP1_HELAN
MQLLISLLNMIILFIGYNETAGYLEPRRNATGGSTSYYNKYCQRKIVCVGFSNIHVRHIQLIVPIYNMKSRCFKSIELTLGHRFLSQKSVRVEEIKCYVESLIPLQN